MGSKNTKIKSDLSHYCQVYKRIIEEIIDGKNFSTNQMVLMVLITQYINFYDKHKFLDETTFSKIIKHTKFYIINQIHKLHPNEYYHKSNINPSQMFKWCIDEYQFCITIYPLLRKFNYHKWYKKYIVYMYTCAKDNNKHSKSKLKQIFMWHSHMLDHTNYIQDIIDIFSYIPYNAEIYPIS